jgi:hypothetical protein
MQNRVVHGCRPPRHKNAGLPPAPDLIRPFPFPTLAAVAMLHGAEGAQSSEGDNE